MPLLSGDSSAPGTCVSLLSQDSQPMGHVFRSLGTLSLGDICVSAFGVCPQTQQRLSRRGSLSPTPTPNVAGATRHCPHLPMVCAVPPNFWFWGHTWRDLKNYLGCPVFNSTAVMLI